jgi:large subunit ribosomal protein L22
METIERSTAKAKVTHIRIAPRKVRIVIDLIRNKPIGHAIAILKNTPKAASPVVEKLLNSAIANAQNNHHMNVDSLYISEVYADQGPTLKRILPRAKGMAHRINKRTSHITMVLAEKEA